MDVRIGLVYSARELELELPDDADVDALKAQVAEVLSDAGGILWLTDKKGSQIALVADKITHIHIGGPADKGRIGFG